MKSMTKPIDFQINSEGVLIYLSNPKTKNIESVAATMA